MPVANRFTFVDALRGVAALNVVFFHAISGQHIPALLASLPPWLHTALLQGDIGVAIFFTLSGFVIAHSLKPEGLTIGGAGRFLLKRSLRLDPPYWAAIAIAISFSLLASSMVKDRLPDHFTIAQVAAHVLYLQELFQIKEINPVFWTLCMEVQFYLIFAILLLMRLRALLLIAFAASVIWPLGFATAPSGLFVGLWYGFLLGAGAYFAWQQSQARPWFYGYVIALLAGTVYHNDIFGMTCCATAVLLYVTARADRIGTYLNWRWIQFLGMISYSLYLIHNPITGATFRIGYILTGHSVWFEVLWWSISLIASITAAAVFYLIIERPSVKLSKLVSIHSKITAPYPITSAREAIQ